MNIYLPLIIIKKYVFKIFLFLKLIILKIICRNKNTF